MLSVKFSSFEVTETNSSGESNPSNCVPGTTLVTVVFGGGSNGLTIGLLLIAVVAVLGVGLLALVTRHVDRRRY